MNTTPYANSLFEQPWWLDIVAPGQWKEVLVHDKNDVVIGRLVYVANGKRVSMPKLTQTLGIWMSPEIKGDYGKQKSVINELFEGLSGYQSVRIALSPENQYVLPFRWMGYQIEPRFTYRLTELQDGETLYSLFNKTAKKNIKYARNKVSICDQTSPETLWEMLNKTFETQNRKNPMNKELVFRIVQKCEETGHGKYLEARDSEGNVHSCAYFVYDGEVCYYLLGASDISFKSSGAQSLIIWEGIQFAAQNSKIFDFEGSMVEGIENFFRQFGGVCVPYYALSRQNLIDDILEAVKPRIKRLIGYKI